MAREAKAFKLLSFLFLKDIEVFLLGLAEFVFSPTPARGNANGISEIIKQKEKFVFWVVFVMQY